MESGATPDPERPPEDLFQAIFGASEESDTENGEESETSNGDERETVEESTVTVEQIASKDKNEKEEPVAVQEKFITVMDLPLSDSEEFGPALPPTSSVLVNIDRIQNRGEKNTGAEKDWDRKSLFLTVDFSQYFQNARLLFC